VNIVHVHILSTLSLANLYFICDAADNTLYNLFLLPDISISHSISPMIKR